MCVLMEAAPVQNERSAVFMVEGTITGARRVSTGRGHSTGGYRQELAKRQVTLPLDIANAGYTLGKSTVKVALKWMQNG